MKFVLGLIVAILVALGIYTYSNQSTEKSNPTPSISEKKIDVRKTEKVSVVAREVQKKKSSVKNITVKSPKVVSQKVSRETEDGKTIGEGLTLEGIENTDVSDEEKEGMRDDMAYYQSLHMKPKPALNEEEILKLIEEDIIKNSSLN